MFLAVVALLTAEQLIAPFPFGTAFDPVINCRRCRGVGKEIYRNFSGVKVRKKRRTEGGKDAVAETAPIKTDKGFVTVTPAGGFIYDEAQSDKNSLTFTNTSLGANAAVYVYDEQSMEYEVQKRQFGYAYPNKEYTSVTIGV